MGTGERSTETPGAAVSRGGWEAAFDAFLAAAVASEADRRLDYLFREYVTPLAKSAVARELRRGPSGSVSRVWVDTQAFGDVRAEVQQKLFLRLRELWEALHLGNAPVKPITSLRGYVLGVVRHACADHLRGRRPGRHALDTALRAAFEASADLALWKLQLRTDYSEWRCGYAPWEGEGRNPVPLWSDPALRARLWQELGEGELTKAAALRRAFDLVQAPLYYVDLLDLLAALWDVEAPYRAADLEASPLRVRTPSASLEDPAAVAIRLGNLQELWASVQPLSPDQRAVLFLRLPSRGENNYLEEFVRLGVVGEADLAAALGLTPEGLRFQYPLMPLEDGEIAALIGRPVDDVRRIRQDARRRLARNRPGS